jgi:segregation and condensation protein B
MVQPAPTASAREIEEEAGWVRGDLPPEDDPPESHPGEAPSPGDEIVQADEKAEAPAAAADEREPEAPLQVGPPPVALSLEALVESLLLVADGAVPVARLAEALEVSPREVETALENLRQSYVGRGLSLQRFRDKVQLTTAPAAAEKVQRFLGLAASAPLSKAALETLAIIAYQQPVTRPQIEAIRGVNSDSVIKNLLSKGLVEESGRTEGPGRPVLYSTTSEFLQHFGLTSLSDLPPLSLEGLKPESSIEILKG